MSERLRGVVLNWLCYSPNRHKPATRATALKVYVWFPGGRSQLATEALFELAGVLRNELVEMRSIEPSHIHEFYWDWYENKNPCIIIGEKPCVIEFEALDGMWMRRAERMVPASVRTIEVFRWAESRRAPIAWDSEKKPRGWPRGFRLWWYKVSTERVHAIEARSAVSTGRGKHYLWEDRASLHNGYCGFRDIMRIESDYEVVFREDLEWRFNGNMDPVLAPQTSRRRSARRASTSVRSGGEGSG